MGLNWSRLRHPNRPKLYFYQKKANLRYFTGSYTATWTCEEDKQHYLGPPSFYQHQLPPQISLTATEKHPDWTLHLPETLMQVKKAFQFYNKVFNVQIFLFIYQQTTQIFRHPLYMHSMYQEWVSCYDSGKRVS